jgi:hypothetical protein
MLISAFDANPSWKVIFPELIIGMLFWLTAANLCGRDRRYYLYRPNKFVDMYDDPRNRHWLVAGGGPGF